MFNQYFDTYSLKLAFSRQWVDSFNELTAFSQSFTVSARAIDRNRANISSCFWSYLAQSVAYTLFTHQKIGYKKHQ